jgi:hypothetical protein
VVPFVSETRSESEKYVDDRAHGPASEESTRLAQRSRSAVEVRMGVGNLSQRIERLASQLSVNIRLMQVEQLQDRAQVIPRKRSRQRK